MCLICQLNVKFHYYGSTSSSQQRKKREAVLPEKNITLDLVQEQTDDLRITVQACARCFHLLTHCLRVCYNKVLPGCRRNSMLASANGSLTGAYWWCCHLVNASEAALPTASLLFLPLADQWVWLTASGFLVAFYSNYNPESTIFDLAAQGQTGRYSDG